jgi:hypothetical protein
MKKRAVVIASLLVLANSLQAEKGGERDRSFFAYPHIGIPANPIVGAGITAHGVDPQKRLYFGINYRYGLGQPAYGDSSSFPALGHDGHTLKISIGWIVKSWETEGQIIRYEGSEGWDVMHFSREKAEITNRSLWIFDWWRLPTGKKDSNGYNHYMLFKKGRLNSYRDGIEIYGEYGYIVSPAFNQLGVWAGFSGCHIEFEKKIPALGYLINEIGMGIGFIKRFDRADTGWVLLWELTWGPALPDMGF